MRSRLPRSAAARAQRGGVCACHHADRCALADVLGKRQRQEGNDASSASADLPDGLRLHKLIEEVVQNGLKLIPVRQATLGLRLPGARRLRSVWFRCVCHAQVKPGEGFALDAASRVAQSFVADTEQLINRNFSQVPTSLSHPHPCQQDRRRVAFAERLLGVAVVLCSSEHPQRDGTRSASPGQLAQSVSRSVSLFPRHALTDVSPVKLMLTAVP